MTRLLAALLVAYVPSMTSLLKRAAAHTGQRGREMTFTGTYEEGAVTQPAKLVVRLPLQCRIERPDAGVVLVRGNAEKPVATEEGASGAALKLVELACPLVAYRGLGRDNAAVALQGFAQQNGADLAAGTSLGRLGDRVAYVLGSPERASPQLWIYKDLDAPARLIAQGGADLRLLDYGGPITEWFPRVLELWQDGRLAARFTILEAKGMRGRVEEEDDSGE